jgi:hypothetical protein
VSAPGPRLALTSTVALRPTLAALTFAAWLAAGLGAGCVTPSIPVPPPDAQRMDFMVDTTGGTASFSYPATTNYIGATVYVFDRNRGKGIIDTARADGSVGPTDPFAASVGDEIDITFQLDLQSSSLCVLLSEGAPSSFCP